MGTQNFLLPHGFGDGSWAIVISSRSCNCPNASWRISFVRLEVDLHFSISFCSSSASPESGLGTSHTSLPGSRCVNDAASAEEMYYEAEQLQPLGTCKALYTFEGKPRAFMVCGRFKPDPLQQRAKGASPWRRARNCKSLKWTRGMDGRACDEWAAKIAGRKVSCRQATSRVPCLHEWSPG